MGCGGTGYNSPRRSRYRWWMDFPASWALLLSFLLFCLHVTDFLVMTFFCHRHCWFYFYKLMKTIVTSMQQLSETHSFISQTFVFFSCLLSLFSLSVAFENTPHPLPLCLPPCCLCGCDGQKLTGGNGLIGVCLASCSSSWICFVVSNFGSRFWKILMTRCHVFSSAFVCFSSQKHPALINKTKK